MSEGISRKVIVKIVLLTVGVTLATVLLLWLGVTQVAAWREALVVGGMQQAVRQMKQAAEKGGLTLADPGGAKVVCQCKTEAPKPPEPDSSSDP